MEQIDFAFVWVSWQLYAHWPELVLPMAIAYLLGVPRAFQMSIGLWLAMCAIKYGWAVG